MARNFNYTEWLKELSSEQLTYTSERIRSEFTHQFNGQMQISNDDEESLKKHIIWMINEARKTEELRLKDLLRKIKSNLRGKKFNAKNKGVIFYLDIDSKNELKQLAINSGSTQSETIKNLIHSNYEAHLAAFLEEKKKSDAERRKNKLALKRHSKYANNTFKSIQKQISYYEKLADTAIRELAIMHYEKEKGPLSKEDFDIEGELGVWVTSFAENFKKAE